MEMTRCWYVSLANNGRIVPGTAEGHYRMISWHGTRSIVGSLIPSPHPTKEIQLSGGAETHGTETFDEQVAPTPTTVMDIRALSRG